MRLYLPLALAAQALTAQTLTITPPVITQCVFGYGHATLSWGAPPGAQVQIRIGDRAGVRMTAISDSAGSAEAGDWITDGMTFFLVNDAAYEYARVTAHVNCGGTPDTTAAALTSSTAYLPLQIGNQWIYRENSRVATSTYQTRTLTRTMQIGDKTWYMLDINGLSEIPVQSDEQGRIVRLPNYPRDLTEEIWLDPARGPATLQVQGLNALVNTPAGQLPIGLNYQNFSGSLDLETGTFARGLGLLASQTTLLAGSSGGFADGLTLIESRIGEGLYFTTPANSVEVAAETSHLNVTGKKATNCAIPCYFAACGIAGADPPDTYKPCFQARVRVGKPACAAPAKVSARLELRNAEAVRFYSREIAMSIPVGGQCQTSLYQQVPLFSTGNTPLPVGVYQLDVRVTSGDEDVGSASVPIWIE